MVSGQQKLDLSLLRRRHDPSPTSSASLSPTVPTLESPVSFQALAVRAVSDTTMTQRNKLDRPPARPSMFIEETDDDDSMLPKLTRGTPADPKSAGVIGKSVEEEPVRRAKSQYFDGFFSARGQELSLRDRLSQTSVIVAELKLSKTVTDDEALVSVVSSRLAHIYQRHESSMMVTIQQNVCIRFGTSKDPSYLLKLYTLPCLIGSITNLRRTSLIQSALRDLLQIEPYRGVVLYLPVPEENFATNGVTYMGEIARHEPRTDDDDPGILRNISRGLSRRLKSNSAHSAPRSEATTSSWDPETDARTSTSVRGNDSLQSEGSREAEALSQGNSRGSKSLRHFLSRRVQNPTGGVEDKRLTMASKVTSSSIREIQGDLFDAPDGAALIHACNCIGSWGGGIAKAFKQKYPAAYNIYHSHCQKYKFSPESIVAPDQPNNPQLSTRNRNIRLPEGTALIIPPQETDYRGKSKKHWIICLFTSRNFGKRVSPPEVIIQNTELAVADMVRQIDELRADESGIGELWSCRFNSGLFGVKWELSRRVLEESGLDFTVVRPEDEDE
ncbi:hypothetical protein ANOM_008465 [Aspergillus nomiae NRRL 13137]|uniref:ADP-ribose 1''-phosphate phosphatase n=1 Tax=Aspergillus nomiae NRRL (strain ATCC 15546 / NRRL 13137 / CBS 260.88 / M93) TaxID=1509407 RepID=A0A0L1IRI5_ASPN3|nr:uncharacterized protein ANOM_008465 [Aspergillus nomiae NRRL 13137]KNG82201.1 hypothetical protein ANOM_008465 [Aspergillus nomiae NRRL 13137]